jgi:hypothetical protein
MKEITARIIKKWKKHLKSGAKTLAVGGEKAANLVDMIGSKAFEKKRTKEEKKEMNELSKLKKSKAYKKELGKSLLERLMSQRINLEDLRAAVGTVRFLSGKEKKEGMVEQLKNSPRMRIAILKSAHESVLVPKAKKKGKK